MYNLGGIILKKKVLTIGILFLYLVLSLIPVTIGYKIEVINNKDSLLSDSNCNSMDVPWPMYCHDVRHSGRSPYNTASNPGYNKWWFKTEKGFVEGSAAIDKDGVIYFGSWNHGMENFFAMNPDGTIKWKYDIGGNVEDTGPAIDENGIIYIGTAYNTFHGDRLFAFYPNGTVKWTYFTNEEIFGSPVINDDGTLYFGHNTGGVQDKGYIIALYPNGTLYWSFKTNHPIYSDPAIGTDGTVYCGCHNGKLYALDPNNGSLKWSFSTGDWVGCGPSIADDGTVIFGSWDGHLYACYPNGTLKWKTGVGALTTPVIGPDGTIYVGSDRLSAVHPENGSIIWSYNVPGSIYGGNPCVSADGIIYCGTVDPGYIVAVNPDGSEHWRKYIGTCQFAPIIGEDGTIYIGTSVQQEKRPGVYDLVGYLYAFNEMEPKAPSAPEINGPIKENSGIIINYTFKSTSPLDNDVFYYIDWDDGDWNRDWWLGPFGSGEEAVISHTWSEPGDFTIRTRCKDSDNLWSDWSEYEVSVPRKHATHSLNWLRFLDMFPILQKILNHIFFN